MSSTTTTVEITTVENIDRIPVPPAGHNSTMISRTSAIVWNVEQVRVRFTDRPIRGWRQVGINPATGDLVLVKAAQ